MSVNIRELIIRLWGCDASAVRCAVRSFQEQQAIQIFVDLESDEIRALQNEDLIKLLVEVLVSVSKVSSLLEPVVVGPTNDGKQVDHLARLQIAATTYSYKAYCDWLQSQADLDANNLKHVGRKVGGEVRREEPMGG
jgi:hypothetical protein